MSHWLLHRLRPRHFLLLQKKGGASAPHFLLSLSMDDESEYVRFRYKVRGAWHDEAVHTRTPYEWDSKSAAENIAATITGLGLPPLDIEIAFDPLFADVGLFDDIDAGAPGPTGYGDL
ncbi:MAG: hypothetical protein QGF53_00840 [Alphaproteobacteria bacterium]|nr:hypothetical protein [Alphaproteobacteria bacterium]